MQRDMRALRDGAVGGSLATLAMSAVMLLARRFGLVGQLPPERIVEAAFEAASARRSKAMQDALAVGAHLLFGTALGAVFGLLYGRVGSPQRSGLLGVGYGLVVWAINYKGWIPALGILPPPEHDRPDRALVMAAAHTVYGGVLGTVVQRRGILLHQRWHTVQW